MNNAFVINWGNGRVNEKFMRQPWEILGGNISACTLKWFVLLFEFMIFNAPIWLRGKPLVCLEQHVLFQAIHSQIVYSLYKWITSDAVDTNIYTYIWIFRYHIQLRKAFDIASFNEHLIVKEKSMSIIDCVQKRGEILCNSM